MKRNGNEQIKQKVSIFEKYIIENLKKYYILMIILTYYIKKQTTNS